MKTPSIIVALCLLLAVEAHADTHETIVSGIIPASSQSACQSEKKAEAEAEKIALKSAQTYCRSEGYGWRAASVKELGSLDCHRCGDDRVSCGYSKISLECRKAEPKLTWLGWLSERP